MGSLDTDAHHIPREAVLVMLLAFALAVTAIALFQTSPSTGLYSLLAIPVAIAARVFGRPAGVLAAMTSGTAIVFHAYLADIALTMSGYAVRTAVFLAVACVAASRQPRLVAQASPPVPHGRLEQPPRRLTPRELEVLRLLALGHTNAEIAEKLVLSVRTVESHRGRLQRKLMRRGRSELTRYALQNGLIEPAEAPRQDGHAPAAAGMRQALPGLRAAAYTSRSMTQPFRRGFREEG